MDSIHEEFQAKESDAGASWRANNVMSWSHVVAYFLVCFLMTHSLLVVVGMMEDHDSLRGDQALGCLFVTETFSSCFVLVYFWLHDHLV